MKKIMFKIMNLMMLSCKKATELIDKKIHFRLSNKENFQLILHKSMCDACKAYEEHSRFLDGVLKQEQNKIENLDKYRPTEQFKANLINKFKK